MKLTELKSNIHLEIEGLNFRQLNEVNGLIQNYLNGTEDTEEWNILTAYQRDRINRSIKQANAGNTKQIGDVTSRLRSKYRMNE